MLIRFGGGRRGIKEYLEKGKKQGREHSRDELDLRVPLEGDLELVDQVIKDMTNTGDGYVHITLGFKEDEISLEMLKDIAVEAKSYVMAAYQPDEYAFYAEAHLPKIESYTNKHTGEFVERKPHIHIVIPLINLVTRQHLHPLGRGEYNEKSINALQEYINHKYGLASPKDNQRVHFNSANEMISRYKGDMFKGQNKDFKQRILDAMLDRKIDQYDEFMNMLADFGKVRTRNEGEKKEYLNIKPDSTKKGINLTPNQAGNYVFSREFIELSYTDKMLRLSREAETAFLTPKTPRPTPHELQEIMQEWRTKRAFEVRYIYSAADKFRDAYFKKSPQEQMDILKQRAIDYQRKFKEVINGKQSTKSNAPELGKVPPPFLRDRLHSMSELDVAHDGSRSKMLLPRDVPNELVKQRTEQHNDVRRTPDRPAERGTERVAQTPVDYYIEQHEDKKLQRESERDALLKEARKNIDARYLLASLSKSHGIQPEKYPVSKAKDGADRIHVGTERLTATDFMTKKMGLDWQTAKKEFLSIYSKQIGCEPVQERQTPKQELWKEYQTQWKPVQQEKKAQAWESQRELEKTRRAAIKDAFIDKKLDINNNPRLSKVEKKVALSVARMEKVLTETELRKSILDERANFNDQHKKPYAEQYRDFLREKAEQGNEVALKELRRQTDPTNLENETKNKIAQKTDQDERVPSPILRSDDSEKFTYKVGRNGDVTYQDQAGRDVMKDVGKQVLVLKEDDKTIETALRFSIQKFGTKLEMFGDDAFKLKVAQVAVDKNIKIEFTDLTTKQAYAALIHDKEVTEQHRKLGEAYLAKQSHKIPIPPVTKNFERDKDRPSRERERKFPDIDHEPER